jgi:hypothetical protein
VFDASTVSLAFRMHGVAAMEIEGDDHCQGPWTKIHKETKFIASLSRIYF